MFPIRTIALVAAAAAVALMVGVAAASAAEACLTERCPPTVAVRVPIEPAPGHGVRGDGFVEVAPSGDVGLVLLAHGPREEIMRPDGGANLIWHLATGTCAAWLRAGSGGADAERVLYRFTATPHQPDALAFSTTIRRDLIDHGVGLRTPAVLVAFRNGGGGQLYACGDVPIGLRPSDRSALSPLMSVPLHGYAELVALPDGSAIVQTRASGLDWSLWHAVGPGRCVDWGVRLPGHTVIMPETRLLSTWVALDTVDVDVRRGELWVPAAWRSGPLVLLVGTKRGQGPVAACAGLDPAAPRDASA